MIKLHRNIESQQERTLTGQTHQEASRRDQDGCMGAPAGLRARHAAVRADGHVVSQEDMVRMCGMAQEQFEETILEIMREHDEVLRCLARR